MSTPRGMIMDDERFICVAAELPCGAGGAIDCGIEGCDGVLVSGFTFVAAIGGFGGGKGLHISPTASRNNPARP